jgi:hypothetical protein
MLSVKDARIARKVKRRLLEIARVRQLVVYGSRARKCATISAKDSKNVPSPIGGTYEHMFSEKSSSLIASILSSFHFLRNKPHVLWDKSSTK